MYKWSYISCCGSPIIHPMFLRDVIQYRKKQSDKERDEILKAQLDQLNKKDPYVGKSFWEYEDNPDFLKKKQLYSKEKETLDLILKKASLDLFDRTERIHGKSCWECGDIPDFLKAKRELSKEDVEKERKRELSTEDIEMKTKRELSKENIEKERKTIWKTSPAHRAAQNGSYILLCFLSFFGANFEAKNKEGKTAYEELVKNLNNNGEHFSKMNPFVKWWILKVTDQHWIKLFAIAAEGQYTESLNILIGCKTNVDVWSTDDGNTALHFAPEAFQKLMDKKAAVNLGIVEEKKRAANAGNFLKQTPLHFLLSSSRERLELTKVLIAAGADVNAKDQNSFTPFHYLFMNSDNFSKEIVELAKVLIETDADINARDQFNKTPLHYLFMTLHIKNTFTGFSRETVELTKVLIEAGADINAKDKYNKTPLNWALSSDLSEEELEERRRILVEAGVDLS